MDDVVAMNERVTPDIGAVFHALAHPIRRAVIEALVAGPQTVSHLAEPHGVSLNAVSKHLKVLEQAGLVTRGRDGTFHRLALRAQPMRSAYEWMAQYSVLWSESLSALKTHLEEE